MNCEGDTFLAAFGAVVLFILGCYLLYKMVEIASNQWGRVAKLEQVNIYHKDDIKNIECSIRYLQQNYSNLYDRNNVIEKKVVDLEHTRNAQSVRISELEKQVEYLKLPSTITDSSGTVSVWSCPEDVTKKKPRRKKK